LLTSVFEGTWPNARGPRAFQIGLSTFGLLALELGLIRWISGQIRVLAYFSNLILIGCFLGMGVGLLAARRFPGLVHLTLPSLAVFSLPIAFSDRVGLMHLTFPDPSVHLWGAESAGGSAGAVIWALGVVMTLFAGVVAVTACAGAALGHLLHGSPGLGAYSADLVGSLLGVLAMSAITALGATPPVWLLLAGLPFAWLSRTPASLVGLVLAVALGQASVAGATYSPYNRIDIFDSPFGATLAVNRDFHQYMHDLRDVAGDDVRTRVKQMYDIPFRLGPERARVLVVGAGTGNDVQAALRNGAASVHSVEIDGRILAIGRERHPERPYSDPRVVPVVDDARAFFEQYRGEPFDVIAYGLVDSHAMFSSLSTLRLDNYLYTEQGLRAAFSHLKPDGVMTVNLSFMGGPWMLRRLYFTLALATGTQPVVVDHGLHGAATLVASRDPAALHFERAPEFPRRTLPPEAARGVLTTSDDWPFLYLRPGVVPWGYLLVLGCVLALALLLVAAVHGGRALRLGFDPALFLMGAGFLLVETRGVTSLSLLFGSTWLVNAAVFSGVLVMALVANVAVQRFPPASPLPAFVLLLASLVVLWLLDISVLNRFPLLARGLLGGLLNALPVGFAGLIVSTLLARSRDLASALASNLLGSVLGGCLEYISMWSGLRALVLLALGLYLGALLRELRRAPMTPGSTA
jgi:SAM-dependent methyltransferase